MCKNEIIIPLFRRIGAIFQTMDFNYTNKDLGMKSMKAELFPTWTSAEAKKMREKSIVRELIGKQGTWPHSSSLYSEVLADSWIFYSLVFTLYLISSTSFKYNTQPERRIQFWMVSSWYIMWH